MPDFPRPITILFALAFLIPGGENSRTFAQIDGGLVPVSQIPLVVSPSVPRGLQSVAEGFGDSGLNKNAASDSGKRTIASQDERAITLASGRRPSFSEQQPGGQLRPLSREKNAGAPTTTPRPTAAPLPTPGSQGSRTSDGSENSVAANHSGGSTRPTVGNAENGAGQKILSFTQQPEQVPSTPIGDDVLPQRPKQTQPINNWTNGGRDNPIREKQQAERSPAKSSGFPSNELPSNDLLSNDCPSNDPFCEMSASKGTRTESLHPPQPLPLTRPSAERDMIGTAGYVQKPAASLPEEKGGMIDEFQSFETQEGSADSATVAKDSGIMDKVLLGPKEKTARKPTSSSGMEILPVLSVLGSLCLVLGVFFVFVVFMRRVGPKHGRTLPKEAFENIGRFALNPKLQLNLLRLGNRLILVATTSDGTVETLSEIDHPDEVVQILGMCRKLDPNGSSVQFQSVLDEFAREKTEGGFFGPDIASPSRRRSNEKDSLASFLAGGTFA